VWRDLFLARRPRFFVADAALSTVKWSVIFVSRLGGGGASGSGGGGASGSCEAKTGFAGGGLCPGGCGAGA
jgi:hypothetical protein